MPAAFQSRFKLIMIWLGLLDTLHFVFIIWAKRLFMIWNEIFNWRILLIYCNQTLHQCLLRGILHYLEVLQCWNQYHLQSFQRHRQSFQRRWDGRRNSSCVRENNNISLTQCRNRRKDLENLLHPHPKWICRPLWPLQRQSHCSARSQCWRQRRGKCNISSRVSRMLPWHNTQGKAIQH